MNIKLKTILMVFMLSLITLFWCEFLNYYVTLWLWCEWPHVSRLSNGQSIDDSVRVMVLSDTHLLGRLRGHWFDKLRREWQMYRSFQTSLHLYSPQMVIILGDIFDEGLWASDHQFDDYVKRFHHLFDVDSSQTKLHVVVGNHDIGFHYWTDRYKFLRRRFEKTFNTSSVDVITAIKDVNFVSINSMAMEDDKCYFCEEAVQKLNKVGLQLSQLNTSSPIVLTHFPFYRESEHICTELDSAPYEEKNKINRVKFDCLSKEATNLIMKTLNPRLALTGHSHYSCVVNHRNGLNEWTVASFSWRNNKMPSFLLAIISPHNYLISKCFLPNENTVCLIYLISLSLSILYIIFKIIIAYSKSKRE